MTEYTKQVRRINQIIRRAKRKGYNVTFKIPKNYHPTSDDLETLKNITPKYIRSTAYEEET